MEKLIKAQNDYIRLMESVIVSYEQFVTRYNIVPKFSAERIKLRKKVRELQEENGR